MTRVDVWCWAVRLFKTRSAATAAAKAGHIRIGDERAKPAQQVRVGDRVRALTPGGERIYIVRGLAEKRVSAREAAPNFEDVTPELPPALRPGRVAVRDRGAGRPTKRDRREIERLLGLVRHGGRRDGRR